jgi:Uma2 family endonuclease
MGATTLASVEDYLQASHRPDREYIDGTVLERNVGEKDHSRLQMLLSDYLYSREGEWGITVFPEQRVQVSSSRFRVPDICVVAGAEPEEQIFTRPPFLCIELLSREDTMRDMQERIDDYLRFGVPNVWLIDPRTRRAWTCTVEGNLEAKDARLRTQHPPIDVDLARIFHSMPKR